MTGDWYLLVWLFFRNSPEARKVGGKYVRLKYSENLLTALKDQFMTSEMVFHIFRISEVTVQSQVPCIWMIAVLFIF